MRISVRSVGSMVVIVAALVSHACGGKADSQPAASSTPPASTAPATATPPASVTPTSTTATAEFGVAECDDYFKKYLACIEKLAPAAQTQARETLDQARTAWKQAASTDAGKSALATTCKAASDAAAPSMRAQGCSW
jgi:hypothetical protein